MYNPSRNEDRHSPIREGYPSKKRNVGTGSPIPESSTTCTAVCQAFAVNDYEEHTSNRKQTQSDIREARQWT